MKVLDRSIKHRASKLGQMSFGQMVFDRKACNPKNVMMMSLDKEKSLCIVSSCGAITSPNNIIIKQVSWFKSSLLLKIQSDYITNINS
jgi:hypothetical protein